MELLQPDLKPSEIDVLPSDILSLLRANDQAGLVYSEELMEELIRRCRGAMHPRAALVRKEALNEPGPDSVSLREGSFQTGKIVARMLKGSREYALFAVTIGEGPENLARQLMEEGNYLEGYMADLIGSALVESATELVHNHIREIAESGGYRVTNRYSPGYCGWDVSEQQKLFGLLPDGLCGIRLSDTSLMTPIKSVSGLIGIGRSVTFREYTCELCSMTQCAFRKVRPASSS